MCLTDVLIGISLIKKKKLFSRGKGRVEGQIRGIGLMDKNYYI